ncbi:MAG: leucyl aminopeptidase, partial [Candidatus Aldehydirespiratoraceae bacterium]
GACMVALGPKIAGVMGNNDAWIDQIRSSSDATGERVWHLPLPEDYKKQFDSSVADMKNIGTPYGGALTAGLILQEFVADGIPWAHIDLAGPAWSDTEEADITKGGTGFGVRLLADLAANFTAPT